MGSAQRIVAENLGRLIGINQNIDLREITPTVLSRIARKIIVQLGCSTIKFGAIMESGIKLLFFKHVSQFGVP